MMRLTLYTTLGCHLCVQFEALFGLLCRESFTLDKVEVADDEALLARYGVRIPVLADADGRELDRGFEPERLAAWLESRGWLDAEAWQRLQRDLAGGAADESPSEPRGAVMRGGRRYLG